MMRTHLSALPALLVGVVVLTAGCSQPRSWEEKPQADPPPDGMITVLFAPVDIGPVAPINPDAQLGFARDMAVRIDSMVRKAQAWVGQSLPSSGEAVWEAGPVGAASGADLVVLTQVLNVNLEAGTAGRPGFMVALVRMRGFNSAGQLVWMKEAVGRAVNEVSPKAMQPGARPESKAAWSACWQGLLALKHYLDTRNEVEPVQDSEPEVQVLIDVAFDSIPPNADIIVDGLFRGNTPTVVPLPMRELTIRVQRQGYQPWEMRLTPATDMRIQPALEPLPGTVSAAQDPVPAPQAAPAPEVAPQTEP